MEAGLDQILADQVQNSQREHVVTVRAKAREFVDVREQIAKYISVTLEKKPPSSGHVHLLLSILILRLLRSQLCWFSVGRNL